MAIFRPALFKCTFPSSLKRIIEDMLCWDFGTSCTPPVQRIGFYAGSCSCHTGRACSSALKNISVSRGLFRSVRRPPSMAIQVEIHKCSQILSSDAPNAVRDDWHLDNCRDSRAQGKTVSESTPG